jgi:hypothetical protein
MRRMFLWSCILPLVFTSALWAQSNRATITGTIVDASGGVIAGVEITATNLGTNVTSSGVSNDAGIYSILNLPAGQYSVKFTKTGFAPFEYVDITLDVGGVAQLNPTLTLGTVQASITVTENAPVLEKETSTVGTNLKMGAINDLPLNIYGGRALETFAVAITPGYSPISDPYMSIINGTQGFTKDFTVDGTSATAQIQGDSFEVAPTMEAVQEVQSETSGLGAMNGITNGGVIMFNLKSGTNKFHGTAFGFGHNEVLDANTWTNNNIGLHRPAARFWDYGFSAGGPIIKNKTFAFGAFERFTQNDFTLGGFGQAATLPTTAFLGGNFSALLDTTKTLGTDVHGNTIYQGAIFNPNDPGAVFVGNIIPTSLFSSVAQKIVAIYQKDYTPQSSSLTQNNLFPSSNSPSQTPIQAVVKLDHILNQNNRLSGSWVYNHRPRTLADSGGVWAPGSTTGGALADVRQQLVYAHELRASESYSIRPNLLNVLNLTYNWYWNGSVPSISGTDWPSTLSFGKTGADNFPDIRFGGSVNGYSETDIGNDWQGNYVGATFIFGDNLSWVKGRHTFTFGGDYRAMEINSHAGGGTLRFDFNNNTTGAPSEAYANQVGFGFASFLLGNVQSASQSTPLNLYGRRKAMSLFAEDNFKLTPKLTLNLGLRWDATFRFHEKYGHWANFDLTANDPNLGIPGAIVYAKNGSDSFEKNQYWTNFGPHIGFAYAPFNKVVFRGSLGLLYVPIGIQYWTGVPYGFAPGFRGTNATSSPFNWDLGYPGVFAPGTKTSTPPDTMFPIVNVDPRSLRTGYTENLNIGVQYELTKDTRIEVSYVGNRGHHLQDTTLAGNQPAASTFFNLVNAGNLWNWVCDSASAVSNGVPYPYPGFCGTAGAAIAPYPQVAHINNDIMWYPTLYNVGVPLGQSFYDSLVVEVTKRTGKGLTMDFNYVLSRQMGNSISNFGESWYTSSIQDIYNLKEAAHTLSPYDQRHVFKGYFTYQLPLGRNQRFFNNTNRWLNGLVGGWQLSSLLLYTSGQPLRFLSNNYYGPGWNSTYVNYDLTSYSGSKFNAGNFTPSTGDNPTPAGNLYFPKSVASNPTYGELGQGPSRVNALRGFGTANENVGLLKNFRFGSDGRYALTFRVEFYNLFNRHNFANPNTDIGSDQFGYVTGISSSPRQGQFGARFEW